MRSMCHLFSLQLVLFWCVADSQVSNVNLNTGQVTLSAQITAARGHDLSLPLTLNYDSRITVRDRSTWVGSGFDLEVPYIERTVIAGPDDRSGHSLIYSSLPASKLDTLKIRYPGGAVDTIRNFHFDLLSYVPLVYKTRLADNSVVFRNGLTHPEPQSACHETVNDVVSLYDPNCPTYQNQTQQDQYYIRNFPKGDRRIFFSEWYPGRGTATGSRADSLTVACDPYAPWKIDYLIDAPSAVGGVNGAIRSWVIRDDDGVQYHFDRRVRMAPTRDFDAARVIYSRAIPVDSIVEQDYALHLTSLSKHSDTTCVRWYLTRMIHPTGDSVSIEYDGIPLRRIDENPYYADVEKFEVIAPESARVPDTIYAITDSMILNGNPDLGIPAHLDWPEVPKSKLRVRIAIDDFVLGRGVEPAMFYTFTPDSVHDSLGNLVYKRSDPWTKWASYPFDYPTELQSLADAIKGAIPDYDTSVFHELKQMHSDSSDYSYAQVAIYVWDESHNREMPPLVFRTSFNPRMYADNADLNYHGSNFHWRWLPQGFADDETNSYFHPVYGEPERKKYSSNSLMAEGAFSQLVFDSVLVFRNEISVQRIELSFQGVNRNWEWISYYNPDVTFHEQCTKSVGRGKRLELMSAQSIAWNSRMMSLRYAPTSDWSISAFPLDYLPWFNCNYAQIDSPWCASPWAPKAIPRTDSIFVAYNTHDDGRSIQKEDGTVDDYYAVYEWKDSLLSRKRHQFRQVVLRNDSKTILDCAWPRRITTPLREIEFNTSAGAERDIWGRPQLTSIITRDRTSGEQLGKVLFDYGSSPLVGHVQLQNIYEQKTHAGPYRRLFSFEYKTDDSLGTDSIFGNMHKGMIKAITDLHGGRTEYTYEPGYFKFLSDGSSLPTSPIRNGFRVKKIVKTGQNVSSPVVTTISYDSGEVAFAPAFTKDDDEAHPTFMYYGPLLSMTDYQVRYGKAVATTGGQGGRTEYRFSTAANTPALVDKRDEYHTQQSKRYKLIEDSKYRASPSTSKVASVRYRYSVSPPGLFTTVGEAEDGLFMNEARYRFSKPETEMATFRVQRTGGGSYQLKEKDATYYRFLRSGLPEANIAGSHIFSLGTEITMRDGVSRRTYRAVNKKGQDSLVIEFKDTTADAEGIAVRKEYMYQKHPLWQMQSGNALSPLSVFTVEKYKDGKSTVMSRDVTKWDIFAQGGIQPQSSYTWREERDSSGTPLSTVSHNKFDFWNYRWEPSVGYENKWQWNARTIRYTAHGKPWMAYVPTVNRDTPFGNPTTVNIYRSDNELQTGTIVYRNVSKTSYREASVFTCDYHADLDPGYWDRSNGWERGGWTNPPVLSDTCHFGDKSVYVVNDYAALRNCRIFPGKSYTFSAWARVDSGRVFLACDYRYASTNHENDWPIDTSHLVKQSGYGVDSVSLSAVESGGQWRLLEMTIPVSRISMSDSGRTWFARVWIGKGAFPTSTGVKAYVDGIRFHPSDALVSTVHYNSDNLMVSAVDANNKARYLEYDLWDRPIAGMNNAGQTLQTMEYRTQGEHFWQSGERYRLLGPNGGETFRVGDQCRVVWLSSDSADPVSIFLSFDGGANYHVVSTNPIGRTSPEWGDFSFAVTLPPEITHSYQCMLMVRDHVNHAILAESEGYFSIVPREGANSPPPVPYGGEYDQDFNEAVLTWDCNPDFEGDTVTYVYEVFTVSTGLRAAYGTTRDKTARVSLRGGTQYIWHVRARDDHGNESSWSEYWQFYWPGFRI